MSEELKQRMRRRVDEDKEEIIKLCSDMVKIPSENPPGDMGTIASFIRSWLEDRGHTVKMYEPRKGRINALARIGEGKGSALILNGHMDVVPAGDSKRWSFPPFCGKVKGGKILGRGATDMKGGLASLMAAFVTVSEFAKHLAGKLVLTIVPDEETGGEFGSKWLVERGKVAGDACLIGEPSGVRASFIGEKGLCWLRLGSKGLPGHGSLPMLGENAIEKLARAFPIIRKIEGEEVQVPSEISELIRVSQDFYREMVKIKGITDEAKLDSVASALDHNTVNIGVVKGGVKTNIVPESCTADIDIRVPRGERPERVKEHVMEMLREAGLADIECEITAKSEPNYTPPTERIYRILDRNVKEVVGAEIKPLFMTAVTDGRFFRLKGIPSINYGPGEIMLAHAYDEYVSTDDLINATKVVTGTIMDFLAL